MSVIDRIEITPELDAWLRETRRYIHMNPRNWREYEYSSLPYYLQQVSDEWIVPKRITELFSDKSEYLHFIEDYEQIKEMKDILKHELADSGDS